MTDISERLKEAQTLYESAGVNGEYGSGLMVDAQARIADLKADLATARNNALQEAANACCHPTNVNGGGESAICRGRVIALSKKPNP
jgi:hypothetical protein